MGIHKGASKLAHSKGFASGKKACGSRRLAGFCRREQKLRSHARPR